jgi:hypothetical protein
MRKMPKRKRRVSNVEQQCEPKVRCILLYCCGNFVPDASARFPLQNHIDFSGCPDNVFIVLIKRRSSRFELKPRAENSVSMSNPSTFPISPSQGHGLFVDYNTVIQFCGSSLVKN